MQIHAGRTLLEVHSGNCKALIVIDNVDDTDQLVCGSAARCNAKSNVLNAPSCCHHVAKRILSTAFQFC